MGLCPTCLGGLGAVVRPSTLLENRPANDAPLHSDVHGEKTRVVQHAMRRRRRPGRPSVRRNDGFRRLRHRICATDISSRRDAATSACASDARTEGTPEGKEARDGADSLEIQTAERTRCSTPSTSACSSALPHGTLGVARADHRWLVGESPRNP